MGARRPPPGRNAAAPPPRGTGGDGAALCLVADVRRASPRRGRGRRGCR
ncbi:hypothetical protein STTU_4849 [Streptomyces sp. Tu6071]|nr:hypothetical protein STTU_4849 [Streptomyces sp. Tu6071]